MTKRRSVHRRRALPTMLLLVVSLTMTNIVTGGSAAIAKSSGASNLRYGFDLTSSFTNTFDNTKSKGDCDLIPYFYLYDTLLHWDGTKLVPGLAVGWKLEGRFITLNLRPNVKFSDGTPMDAEAVKTSLLDNRKNAQLTSIAIVDNIDVLDPTTIRLHTKDDTGIQVVYALTSRDGVVMAPSSYTNGNTPDKKPIGAGPFMFKSFQPGARITLVRNPLYWDKSAYQFPGIEFTQAAAGPPSLTALRSGSIDIARFDADAASALKRDSSISVSVVHSDTYLQLQFRRSKAGSTPFDNEKVRQAIRYAIDRTRVNKIVLDGLGEPATQGFRKASPAYNASLANAYPYNPRKAKQLLKEAGYPKGFSFALEIPGGGIASMESQGVLIQDMLKQVGIKAKIGRVLGSDIATQYYIQGKGDAFAAARTSNKLTPGQIYDQYGKFQFVALWNHAEDATLDDLMIKAQSTQDLNVMNGMVKQANKYISDHALEVPIAFMPQLMAYKNQRVGGKIFGQTDICDPGDLSKLKMKG
jgi:peptide/nickel transport system substrate-binding protein